MVNVKPRRNFVLSNLFAQSVNLAIVSIYTYVLINPLRIFPRLIVYFNKLYFYSHSNQPPFRSGIFVDEKEIKC